MTAEHIEITYVDNENDLFLSDYLVTYKVSNIKVKYNEIIFGQEYDYDCLMNHDDFKNSDIIIIDSRLYKNNNTRGNNCTGEALELLLRVRSPYVEVIVVTQNYVSENSATLKKASGGSNYEKHYNDNLKPFLDYFVKRAAEYRKIKEKISKENFDKFIFERIGDFLNHDDVYSLSSKDIDKIIQHLNNISKR